MSMAQSNVRTVLDCPATEITSILLSVPIFCTLWFPMKQLVNGLLSVLVYWYCNIYWALLTLIYDVDTVVMVNLQWTWVHKFTHILTHAADDKCWVITLYRYCQTGTGDLLAQKFNCSTQSSIINRSILSCLLRSPGLQVVFTCTEVSSRYLGCEAYSISTIVVIQSFTVYFITSWINDLHFDRKAWQSIISLCGDLW